MLRFSLSKMKHNLCIIQKAKQLEKYLNQRHKILLAIKLLQFLKRQLGANFFKPKF